MKSKAVNLEEENDFGSSEDSTHGEEGSVEMRKKLVTLDSFLGNKRTKNFELLRMYKQRLPYMIEDYLGINMNYYTSIQIPNNVIVSFCTS